eukprot:TRINITY_DN26039_c0_g1_i1.p1 TRINITY_DN26039_c0_g1~~TRINITY_DN26039_c0_g1_i1.p1  ORF type:complete len:335 (+),score=61.19 TRINITY_DN26039_c0_g1_i1:24-1028(+)
MMKGVHVEYGCYSFVLALLYFVITLVSLFQISRIGYYRHNIFHYQFGFLVFCFVWGAIRTTFWLLMPWSTRDVMWLQGSALWIQFATFSLLVLFYAQVIHKAKKKIMAQNIALIIYIIFNVIFLTSFVVMFVVEVNDPDNADDVFMVHAFLVGSMYIILASFLVIYGWKLSNLVDLSDHKIPFLRNQTTITSLTIILFIVFTSRAVKDIMSGASIGIVELTDPVFDTIAIQAFKFSLYFVWEIIPAAMVLGLFWHIPGRGSLPPAVPIQRYEDSDPDQPQHTSQTALFSNPDRYDSDTEHSSIPTPVIVKPNNASYTFEKTRLTGYNTMSPLNS